MSDRKPALLTVSGSIPNDLDERVADGRRPRADYRAIGQAADADIVDVDRALRETGRTGRLLHRLAGAGPLLAWYGFRRRREFEVIVTDGEQVGLPLALLTRMLGRGGSRHVMIVHILSVPKKSALIRVARLASQVDRYVVYCSRQGEFIRDRLGVEAARVSLSTFMVDTDFFAPGRAAQRQRRLICSAGLERRDYPTLMDAVEGLDVDVVIAAASPWSKQPDSSLGRSLPDNVDIRRLDLFELRQLYAESAFVVMPLFEVDFQAGITTILEAFAMERGVVCTTTEGQTDTIVDGETGIYVPAGDAQALRAVIVRLLDDEPEAARLGRNARRWVVDHADIIRYAESVAAVVGEVRVARSSGVSAG